MTKNEIKNNKWIKNMMRPIPTETGIKNTLNGLIKNADEIEILFEKLEADENNGANVWLSIWEGKLYAFSKFSKNNFTKKYTNLNVKVY